jgi:hypothetical protein
MAKEAQNLRICFEGPEEVESTPWLMSDEHFLQTNGWKRKSEGKIIYLQ